MMEYSPLPPFAAWAGPRNPKILFIGEAFGEGEDISRKPFSGEAGKEFWRMLGEAMPDVSPELHSEITSQHRFGLAWIRSRESWMADASIALTNVFNFRPPNNKIPELCTTKKELPNDYSYPPIISGTSGGKYLRPDYLPEIERLSTEIIHSNPNLICPLGNTACWAILRTTAITGIRGTTTQATIGTSGNEGGNRAPYSKQFKCLPTFHPANVLYNWSVRPIVIADLAKAKFECEFSEIRRPQRQILVNPTLDEVSDWIFRCIRDDIPFLGCDVETSLGMIDTFGFARSQSDALVIPFGPHRKKRGENYTTIWPERNGKPVASYWEEWEERIVWKSIRTLLESSIPKVFQNGLYDLQYISRMGIRPNMVAGEDTMLLHHSLFPEMPKGLGFLGSIYTNEASWKLMRTNKSDSEKRDE